MEHLISAGADANLVCDNMTPCMWAASNGDIVILEYLLKESKADFSKVGDEKNLYGSPLHMACLCNQARGLKYMLHDLVTEGYDAVHMSSKLVNYGGLTCLHICARQNAVDCFKILIDFLQG